MALRVIETCGGRLACPATVDATRDALAAQGAAVVLVPTLAQALDAQMAFAEAGLTMGLTVTTPEAWAAARWEVWGTGERIVAADAAAVIMREVLGCATKDERRGLGVNVGTASLLRSLARRALPWLPVGEDGQIDRDAMAACGLSAAESAAVGLVGSYRRALQSRGLVEWSEVASRLPRLLGHSGAAVAPIVVVGFCDMEHAVRELVVGVAGIACVTIVVSGGGHSGAALIGQLSAMASRRGVGVSIASVESEDEGEALPRSAELRDLMGALREIPPDSPVTATGDVRLLEAAGPLAEAELVAREVVAQADSGARTVVVVTGDAHRVWRELSPKLAARGISSRAQLAVPLERTEAGRAFVEYVTTVADLVERAATWPEQRGDVRRLGDMGWWPPRGLSDFLLSSIAHVEHEKAVRLDAAWRSNRLLAPGDVIAALLSAKVTSAPVERATRELLRGRLGSAASRLLAPLEPADAGASGPPHDLATLEATAVLGAVLNVSGTLRDLGVSADPKAKGDVRTLPLSDLVEMARDALGATSVTLRPAVSVEGASCEAMVVSPAQAAQMAPASADAVVVCGLTSEEWPLVGRSPLLEELLVALGIEERVDQVRRERAAFRDIVGKARQSLVLERTLFAADSSPRWPSPLLQDVLACYESEDELSRASLGEGAAAANVMASGVVPPVVACEAVAPAGRIDAALRDLVIVPPEGTPAFEDGLPQLSASQIESYLECPYKWFSLRRLRLWNADAACGPLEKGTFVHRVLELSHRRLLAEALPPRGVDPATAALVAELAGIAHDAGAASLSAGPTDGPSHHEMVAALSARVAGSRATANDEEGLAHAREIVREEFEWHLERQYLTEGGHARFQALVAHTARERGGIEELRRDLLSTVDYEAGRLVGFEPRLFEWGFGGRGAPITYAGARLVGTIDRVDVDAHGNAVIVDYKHKGPDGFVGEYAAFGKAGAEPGAPLVLPRRVQALIYAQVMRRAFPGMRIAGAVYLGTRGTHKLAGAVGANLVDRVLGMDVSAASVRRMLVPETESFGLGIETSGMDALLDAVEDEIARRIDELREGNVEARPIDAEACRFCPVMRCERRAM